MKRNFILITLLLFSKIVLCNNSNLDKNLFTSFIKNEGQWPSNIIFKADIPNGNLFCEKNKLVYNFIESKYFSHDISNTDEKYINTNFKGHAFYINFENANPNVTIYSNEKLPSTRNYFLGNDKSKWTTNVPTYSNLIYKKLYKKIDFSLYQKVNSLKYDFIVQPGGDPNDIKLTYEGIDALKLNEGKLIIKTSVNEIIEKKPYSYQLINGKKVEIACEFQLINNTVQFKILSNYNKSFALIIDPEIVFVTYTGAANGLSANCTTADQDGNTYTAGYAFGMDYPVTPGAFQTQKRGLNVAISKFNTSGTNLLYATYLGGNNEEYPFALQVNAQNELIILGNTYSFNFPVLQNSYNTVKNGNFDYFVSKLSTDGSSLLASTFIGGSDLEGGRLSDVPSALTTDSIGNIYIVGCTRSFNFPIVSGFQKNISSGVDGVIAKFNSNLTNLLWSTYLGGFGDDVISDIKVGKSGKIYVTGYTSSSNLPTTPNVLNQNFIGLKDGFIGVITTGNNQIEALSYIGTSEIDIIRFLDLDSEENVYLAGFSNAQYPVTSGTFGNNNASSGYFIHKLTNNLKNTIFTTHIGDEGNSVFNYPVPTAFKVDKCGNIYLSGYAFKNTYPTSTDAFSKDLRSIYFCQLTPNAQSLIYGSFLGSVLNSSISNSHIHYANRSYFSETGELHHIECTTSETYPVTPGAYSIKINSSVNEGGVFKFKFDKVVSNILKASISNPNPAQCPPYKVEFQNNSIGGISYNWNFGDGSVESNIRNPIHIFDNPGKYRVRLIISGYKNCNISQLFYDTTYTDVEVESDIVFPPKKFYLCEGFLELNAQNPGANYLWFNGSTSQTLIVNKPGQYGLEISKDGCKSKDTITVSAAANFIIPNVMTPNNDGINDYFEILNNIPNTKLKIYNRWGQLVLDKENYENNWNGNNLKSGVYYYLIDNPATCDGVKKGWFEIIK